MNKYFALFFLLCSAASISNAAHNYYLIDGLHEDNNVIKIWYTALGLLDEYDKGLNAGFEILFNQNGKHFSAERGPNWWQYYFGFHAIGSSEHSAVLRIPRHKRSTIRFNTVCTMSVERGHYLLNTYMRLQPAMQEQLNQIKHDYWPKDIPVVGVYYQHPIIPEVQPPWDPVALCERVKHEVKDIGVCKIFLCTDLQDFAMSFKDHFGPQCVDIPHLRNDTSTTPAERGQHELLTLLLLAECNMVIAPGSYQGIGAKMLNPDLQLIELDTFPYALK